MTIIDAITLLFSLCAAVFSVFTFWFDDNFETVEVLRPAIAAKSFFFIFLSISNFHSLE